LDEHGVKFSKKFGNFVDPNLLLDKYGSDVLRLYFQKSPLVNAGELFFKESAVEEVSKKLIPYLSAITFFIDHYKVATRAGITDITYIGDDCSTVDNITDKWILEKVSMLRVFVEEHMFAYSLDKPVIEIISFIDDLTNWYIKLNRLRMKGKYGEHDQIMSLSVLFTVLYDYARISAPVMPFTSEHVFQQLKYIATCDPVVSIHMAQFPTAVRNFGISDSFQQLQKLCKSIRYIRDSSGTHNSVKVPIECVTIYENDENVIAGLSQLIPLIQDELNCDKFEFNPTPNQTYSLKPNFKVLGKKYKKNVQMVVKHLESIDSDASFEYFSGCNLSFQLDGADFDIMQDECEVVVSKNFDKCTNPNVKIVERDGLLLAVDLTKTQEGIERYYVKCFCKLIQNCRKDMELKPWNKINISYSTESAFLSNILQKHSDVLSTSENFVKQSDFSDGLKFNIDDENLRLKISLIK